MKFRENDGFTLVELLITIVIASIVTLAATTVLLLGIRLNAGSSKTAENQNTARIFMNVMDKMASSGAIKSVESDASGWKIKDDEGESGKVLFSYDPETQTIYTGTTPMIEDVMFSSIYLDGNILTVGIENEDGAYTSSIYCRMVPNGDTEEAEQLQEVVDGLTQGSGITNKARAAFLKVLLTQRGSTGMILEKKGDKWVKTPIYYSRWYDRTWPSDTAWCACFVSWALKQVEAEHIDIDESREVPLKYYASVGYFKQFFEGKDDNGRDPEGGNNVTPGWNYYDWTPENYDRVQAGDLVFFDWDTQAEPYLVEPDHIGVFLMKSTDETGSYIYTIEGNTANMVAIRRYKLDSNQIMGFGVVDWKEDPA